MGRQRVVRGGVVGARGQCDRALTHGGQKRVDVEQRGGAMAEAEPLQSRVGEQRRVDLAALGLSEPRLDVAAQQTDPQIRAQAA